MVSHLPPEKTENKHLFTSTVACSKTKTTIATKNNQPVQKKWHYLVQLAIARNMVDLDGIKVNRNNNFPVQKMVWLHPICMIGTIIS